MLTVTFGALFGADNALNVTVDGMGSPTSAIMRLAPFGARSRGVMCMIVDGLPAAKA